MPGAGAGFAEVSALASCPIVSARAEVARGLTERWLERHLGTSPPLYLRPGWEETSAAYKVRMLRELGAVAHFEDDPHTAAWLADEGIHVFLVDWARNRWLEHPGVTRVRRIVDALPAIRGLAGRRAAPAAGREPLES
jgi:hypothetical protein